MMKFLACSVIALIVIIILVIVGVPVVRHLTRKTTTWTVETEIGGKPAEVKIAWTRDKEWPFWIGHSKMGGGNWEHDTVVQFGSGKTLCFETFWEPIAIWELGGRYYVVTALFSLFRVEADGSLTKFLRSNLPEGPKPWNLVSSEPDQKHYQDRFDDWVE